MTAPKRTSRLLAALDSPGFLNGTLDSPVKKEEPGTPLHALKRKFERDDTGASSAKFLKLAGIGNGSPSGRRVPADPLKTLGIAPSTSAKLNPALHGFNLNYDADAPIKRIDAGGVDQHERMHDFMQNMANFGESKTVKEAMKDLGLRNDRDVIPGLEVRLLPHQIIGVSWMLFQEKDSGRKGGIMADEMGLGKTVQMIATMALNQPSEDTKHSTTLIIVPAALLQQWKEELETKTNGLFSVHIHHGKDKLKKLAQLRSYDVIITTYQTLNLDFSVPSDVDEEEEEQYLANNGGLLARMKWYRVVIDEAQFIRNRRTRSSTAVSYLRTQYRWMLTGTPVTNSLADIFGFLRFGRFRPWNDWRDFDEYVAKVQEEDAPLAGLRAQEILKPLMLRRTKDAQLEGKPLLQLPPIEIDLCTLEFSKEERELYDCFEKRTRIRVNRFLRRGALLKNNAAVLTMILRLRQLCCHPNLILSQADEYADPTLLVGSENDKEQARAKAAMGAKWVEEIKQRFLARARASEFDFDDELDEPAGTCPVCADYFMNDSGRILACGHEMCFDCLLELSNSPITHNGEFGHGSEKENLQAEKEYETAAAKGLRPCPTCKKMTNLQPNAVFKAFAFEPTPEEVEDAIREHRRNKRRAKKRKAKPEPEPEPERDIMILDSDDEMPSFEDILAGRTDKKPKREEEEMDDDAELDLTMNDISGDPSAKLKRLKAKKEHSDDDEDSTDEDEKEPDAPSDKLINTWRKGDHDMEPSAKLMKLVELVNEWEVTGDKTIVYSQWTSMLDLVEVMFSRMGIRNLRYDGKLSREQRDQVISTFRQSGGPKVMLISTKCGGVGLNLVSANRIINLDLSWNYAAEAQAYARAHRLGQEKSVYVKRLVVRDTLEERMLHLQEVKTGLAEAALGEGTGAKLHKLSVKEIKLLFGIKPAPTAKDGRREAAGADED